VLSARVRKGGDSPGVEKLTDVDEVGRKVGSGRAYSRDSGPAAGTEVARLRAMATRAPSRERRL
jgi:hypothetical protein